MALPIGLITALAPVAEKVISRFIDKKKVESITNMTTVTGGSMMGSAAFLIAQPEPNLQLIGYALGLAGMIISLIKEKKK